MALQGKFLRFCNVLNNYKNVLGATNTFWYNYPCMQQVAGIRQKSLEEKINIPLKPKRPLTPYFKYMALIRPEVKKQNPKASVTDLVREISLRWEKVDTQTKEKLESEYKQEQAIYAKERLEYDTNLTPQQRELIKEAKHKMMESKEKRILKQKIKANNKPKKSCSAFVHYMKSELPNRGTKDFKTFQKDVAESWKKLTDAQKKPFVDQMREQMKEYKKEMVEWERKMIKMGNTDIVRQDALIEPKLKVTRKKIE